MKTLYILTLLIFVSYKASSQAKPATEVSDITTACDRHNLLSSTDLQDNKLSHIIAVSSFPRLMPHHSRIASVPEQDVDLNLTLSTCAVTAPLAINNLKYNASKKRKPATKIVKHA